MRRTLYLLASLVLAAAAALLTLRAQHTVPVVVAGHDLRGGTLVQAADLEVVRMHDDGLPAGVLHAPEEAVGRYLSWPVAGGEPLLGRMLRARRSGGTALAGLDVPDGYRAIAVPVAPAAAVGGMLAPGDHVDVWATPLPGHQAPAAIGPGAASEAAAGARLLGRDVLVLQLRSDQGQPLDAAEPGLVRGLNFGVGKLGAVVLAVPAGDVDRYAAATAGESIYLALGLD